MGLRRASEDACRRVFRSGWYAAVIKPVPTGTGVFQLAGCFENSLPRLLAYPAFVVPRVLDTGRRGNPGPFWLRLSIVTPIGATSPFHSAQLAQDYLPLLCRKLFEFCSSDANAGVCASVIDVDHIIYYHLPAAEDDVGNPALFFPLEFRF